jgi:hypothetical protein
MHSLCSTEASCYVTVPGNSLTKFHSVINWRERDKIGIEAVIENIVPWFPHVWVNLVLLIMRLNLKICAACECPLLLPCQGIDVAERYGTYAGGEFRTLIALIDELSGARRQNM